MKSFKSFFALMAFTILLFVSGSLQQNYVFSDASTVATLPTSIAIDNNASPPDAYSAWIDMWSIGCVLAELYIGLPLFAGDNEQEQLSLIMQTLGVPPVDYLKVPTAQIQAELQQSEQLLPQQPDSQDHQVNRRQGAAS